MGCLPHSPLRSDPAAQLHVQAGARGCSRLHGRPACCLDAADMQPHVLAGPPKGGTWPVKTNPAAAGRSPLANWATV